MYMYLYTFTIRLPVARKEVFISKENRAYETSRWAPPIAPRSIGQIQRLARHGADL